MIVNVGFRANKSYFFLENIDELNIGMSSASILQYEFPSFIIILSQQARVTI